MNRPTVSLFIIIAAFLIISACMRLGPDYQRPDPGVKVPDTFQNAPEAVLELTHPEDSWWQVFGDTEIDLLVNEVLKNNLDIKKAAARILEIQSQFVQTRAERFPELGLEARRKRQSQTVTSSLTGTNYRLTTDSYALALPATFEWDLWGRLARAEEAARADLLYAQENRHTVAQTVVAETISLYLQMESMERRIQLLQKTIENFEKNTELVEARYTHGLTPVLDVRQARRLLAQAESGLPPLYQTLGVVQQKMSVLLGRYPVTRPPRNQPEDYFNNLAPVPPGLPSDLLLRRPDIRAAESQLKALNALVGVAKASRFPRITLTGSFGYSSEQLNDLFNPKSDLWNLALGAVQPLFDAGKLKAGQKAAQARYAQGLTDYAKAVLGAFSEVEEALLTRRQQLQRRRRVLNFLDEARATRQVAQNRYRRGLVDYLSFLDAQRVEFNAEESLILVDFSILNNRVALHRSLGGGWAHTDNPEMLSADQ